MEQLFTVSRADGQIAFQVEDASRGEVHEAEGEDAAAAAALTVGMETRLDNRWIDLRTPANQAIMRIKSTVCCLFREFFNKCVAPAPAPTARPVLTAAAQAWICGDPDPEAAWRRVRGRRRRVQVRWPQPVPMLEAPVLTWDRTPPRFDYFGRTACLAQSPQLYKQMMAACAGFEKVFEVGPVFRAEKSHTHRAWPPPLGPGGRGVGVRAAG